MMQASKIRWIMAAVVALALIWNMAGPTSAEHGSEEQITICFAPDLDYRPPITQVAAESPPPNQFGWNNTDVSLTLFARDPALVPGEVPCGVASIGMKDSLATAWSACYTLAVPTLSCTFTLSSEGVRLVSYHANEAGGRHAEAVHSLSVRIDKTPPTVTYSGNATTYTVDQVVTITCAATDALSGIASSTCQDVSGPAYSFSLGTNTFSATAIDKAGNAGSGSTTFAVQVTSDALCNLTRQLAEDPGVAKSLCVKLANSNAAEARGDQKAAAVLLDAYTQEVSAQSGKTLAAEQAAILTRLTRALRPGA
jgi:hypothetical protein